VSGLYLVSQPLPLSVHKWTVKDCGYGVDGDVVGCEDQSLGEVVGVVGTPYTLHYQSERTPGGRVIEIDVSGETLPAHLYEYEVTVRVAGREFFQRYAPEANLTILFAWDGRDDQDEIALGAQWATVEVVEIYVAGDHRYRWAPRLWGGTLGGWDPRAQGLGGWSLDAHHFFDPIDRTLYLGSGGQRSGAELGVVQEDGDDVLIASENGLSVYVFERETGVHRETRNALTGAVVTSFAYSGVELTGITTGGQETTVSSGSITSPYNEITTVGANGDGYWETISNPAAEMSFEYTPFAVSFARLERTTPMADGLLTKVTDPKDGEWTYTYNARGQLGRQDDAGQGSISATRGAAAPAPGEGEIREAYSIDLRTAGNKLFQHVVKEFTDGSASRKITTPDGETSYTIGADLSESGTHPWGTFSRVRQPGQRQLLDSSGLPARLGSLKTDYKLKRTNPLDLTVPANGFTQSTNWNDAATSSSGGEGTTLTSTTPGGRTVSTTTDDTGRPQSVKLPGMPKIDITYDNGRPVAVTQSGRKVRFGYQGAFVSSITDPLGRTVTIPREGDGRVGAEHTFGIQSFDYSHDSNGNLTGTTSPQSGGYSEANTYTPVDLVESFTLPAGQTTISYTTDREPSGGTSPHGALEFDGEGRLTDVGDTHYTYDADDYLTRISSPDGTIDYNYQDGSLPVPTSISWDGSVEGTVTIGRNDRYQATSIGVGGHSADITVDPDGMVTQVVTQAGVLAMDRDQDSGFLKGTTLGNTTDRYERNALGEPMRYVAEHDTVGELFSEEYVRDTGGRIRSKTVRIRNADTGVLEQYTVDYGYDAPGRLQSVVYNRGDAAHESQAHYAYDANNNLIGAPAVTPTPAIGPIRLYLQEGTPAATPAATVGAWTNAAADPHAAMGLTADGAATSTMVSAADCDAGSGAPRRLLATVFTSPPLDAPYLFQGSEQFRVVVGAGQPDADQALQPLASIWVMNGATGAKRCAIATDWSLTGEPAPSPDAAGIEDQTAIVPGDGSCEGVTAQADDRVVVELGFACTATSVAPVSAEFWRGGTGIPLSQGGDPTEGTCDRPGYLQIEANLEFQDTAAPSSCGPASTTISVNSRQLLSVTVNGQNHATASVLVDPQGTTRRYQYTYDPNGALEMKVELDEFGQQIGTTTYDYDLFGNLRHVGLPDGRAIHYLIDAANRRVGRVLTDGQGTHVQKFLYQSGLRPVAELDGANNVVAFFVYGDKPNVPEYMEKGGERYRLVTDRLGSVRLVTRASDGAIAQRLDYDEHGNVLADTNPGFQPFGWAGGLYDSSIGLMRFGARDYAPVLDRWVSADPIGFGGADGNLYVYVGNDPVNLIDPTGLKDYSEEETLQSLKEARADATAWNGKWRLREAFQGGGKFDFATNQPNDTFEVDGHLYFASEFGNYLAGYAGTYNGQTGYALMRFFGVVFDYTDSRDAENHAKKYGGPLRKRFDFDRDSLPEIYSGARRARAELRGTREVR